ncbi:Phosphate-import ATP-binding protein PhnC [Pseudovibrio axinellae]|uniref:Phosphate-import ATP-binding protein PhnC n=1 Tax=Pseudovibrio axinellae TaxID=989403 RepID=A0A165WQD5_9HYPH|nr:phosphonate ABC transporter ATP-binding protein [Pseudovibrio axinellae]KZL16790.1 Phosphate-import ATP-binding protein PhnC [Pseudovibrio axinellae]SEQ74507.1 phosphonate transport system ATP-binding protein [Pseudovibrio axinellae]
MIQFESVRKEFGAHVAVTGASFTIEKPQMIGIIGRSGAGKSTLLRMINRLTPATSGRILVDGVDVLAMQGQQKRHWQRDCAMIFQQFNLVPRLDVLTNVMLGRLHEHGFVSSMLKLFTREERVQALLKLERLGLAETALKRAENLSGGQQQRVAIARALMQGPKVLLADEPIASLDPMNAQVVMNALKSINTQDGLTVICNLHTLDTARSYCDRVIGMRDGDIIFDGQPEELSASVAREIYGADESFEEGMTSTSLGGEGAKIAVMELAKGASSPVISAAE